MKILPQRIVEEGDWRNGHTQLHACSLHNCFDYSRCSLTSHFPVYLYSPELFILPSGVKLNTFVRDSVNHAFGYSPHLTFDPHTACVYVVLIGDISPRSVMKSDRVENYLNTLPHWGGDGRNHILLHVSHRLHVASINSLSDPLGGVDIGRAMIARSFYSSVMSYRTSFDVIIPPSFGISHGEVWSDLPMLTPARRKHLFTFQGEYQLPFKLMLVKNDGFVPDQPNNNNENEEILALQEKAIVETAKQMQLLYPDLNFLFQFSCLYEHIEGLGGEWGMCGPDAERKNLLEQSTFTLIVSPTNVSALTGQLYTATSTLLFQSRLYEALKYGAIPVIIGGDYNMLPYADMVNWRTAVLTLPHSRVTELHYFIRSFTDMDVLAMRQAGRMLWQTYLGSTRHIVDALLSNVRTRLQIPAFPARDEPSPSVFNETFRPLVSAVMSDTAVNTDDMLGPIETPFPSPTFLHNFTYSPWMFSGNTDPHHLYPSVPFADFMPGEAKFIGNNFLLLDRISCIIIFLS